MTNSTMHDNDNTFHKRVRIAILIVQLILAAFFLFYAGSRTELGPTLDDAWVYFQFSKNVVEHGEISFNPGHWSNCTSLAWILVIAVGMALGIPPVAFIIVSGLLLYLVFGQLVYTLFGSFWEDRYNRVFSILVIVFTGNVIWYSFSGMETMFFLTLGLCWIFSFIRGRYIIAGLIAGILSITRTEGLVFFAISFVFTLRKLGFRSGIRPALLQAGMSLLVYIPASIMNYIGTGEAFPHTFKGKQFLYGMDIGFWNLSLGKAVKFFLAWASTFFQGNWWPELMERPWTIQYPLLRIVTLGRIDKSPGEFPLEPNPLFWQIVAALIGAALFFVLIRGLIVVFSKALKNLPRKREYSPWEFLVYWIVGLNAIYLVLLPIRGHGGRYQAVNFILFGLLMIAGVEWKSKGGALVRKFKNYIVKPGIILIYFIGIFSWADIYTQSIWQINIVHRAAGEWLKENLPPDTKVAVFDGGAIKYFSQLPVVDIAGIFEAKGLEEMLKGKGWQFLEARDTHYLAMIEGETPSGNPESDSDEAFFSLFYDQLKLREGIGKKVSLTPIARFEMPMVEWWRHWTVMITHSPIVVVYEIDYIEEQTVPEKTILTNQDS